MGEDSERKGAEDEGRGRGGGRGVKVLPHSDEDNMSAGCLVPGNEGTSLVHHGGEVGWRRAGSQERAVVILEGTGTDVRRCHRQPAPYLARTRLEPT